MTCHFMAIIIPGDINLEECVMSVSKLSVDKYLNYCWCHSYCTFTYLFWLVVYHMVYFLPIMVNVKVVISGSNYGDQEHLSGDRKSVV